MKVRIMLSALGAIAIAWGASAGCSSDDAGGGADAATQEAAIDPCTLFTEAGAPCPVAHPKACFPECASGGCFCLEGPNGEGLRWTCVTDLSCMPDGSPLDDTGTPEAAAGDATGDDGGDASSARDASDASDANDAGDASDGASD
jgi:hypothetical protein